MEMYFLADGKTPDDVEVFENIEDCANYIIENANAYDEYNEYLDCDGCVNVAGLEMYPSIILKKCDPIAYDCGYSDFMDFSLDEIKSTLENMSEGDVETIFGIEVEAHEMMNGEEED